MNWMDIEQEALIEASRQQREIWVELFGEKEIADESEENENA